MPDTEPEPKPKGHWPKGKRRNIDQGLLDKHGEPGVYSLAVIADALGVDKRTVHKWLKGINRPDDECQDLLRQWLKEARDKIESRKRRGV